MTGPQQPSAQSLPPSSGLAPNVAGALAYLLGPITGIFFLVIEKQNQFVRFHAAQSTVISVALFILGLVLSVLEGILAMIPIVGWLIAILLSLALGFGGFILWLVLMYRAYQGREWEVPFAGAQARKLTAPTPAAE
ncbi:MAG TPA: DUF4870 domain-containing protein [Gemmatimonadaceae bacterium]